MYYRDVVDLLQMNEHQAMASRLFQLREWALQVVLDLLFRFWLSESGVVIISLGQYFDIPEKRVSSSGEE